MGEVRSFLDKIIFEKFVSMLQVMYQRTIHQDEEEPHNPTIGMLWIDTATGELRRYAYQESQESYGWIKTTGGELSDELQAQYNSLLDRLESQREEYLAGILSSATAESLNLLRENMASTIAQIIDNTNARFSHERNYVDDMNDDIVKRVDTIESHVTIHPDSSITIALSDDSMQFILEHEELKVQFGAETVSASFKVDGLTVPKITINEQFALGGLVWQIEADGSSSLRVG